MQRSANILTQWSQNLITFCQTLYIDEPSLSACMNSHESLQINWFLGNKRLDSLASVDSFARKLRYKILGSQNRSSPLFFTHFQGREEWLARCAGWRTKRSDTDRWMDHGWSIYRPKTIYAKKKGKRREQRLQVADRKSSINPTGCHTYMTSTTCSIFNSCHGLNSSNLPYFVCFLVTSHPMCTSYKYVPPA